MPRASVLVAAGAVPVPLAGADVVPAERRHLRLRAAVHADARALRARCGRATSRARSSTAWSPARCRPCSRCCSACRPPTRSPAGAFAPGAQWRCGSWRRAWRRRSPSRSRSSSPTATSACIDTVLGLALIYLTFNLALVDLDDADLLRRRAARARGGGLDRRLRHLGRLPADHAAAHRTRPRRDGGAVLHLLLERLLLRPDPDPDQGA